MHVDWLVVQNLPMNNVSSICMLFFICTTIFTAMEWVRLKEHNPMSTVRPAIEGYGSSKLEAGKSQSAIEVKDFRLL